MKYKNVRLQALSPVHIGTGQILDPLSYLIREDGGSYWLHQLDIGKWVSQNTDPDELSTFLSNNNLVAGRSRIAADIDVDFCTITKSKVYSREMAEEYLVKLSDTNTVNQLKIAPTMRNPFTQAPFIPGSSIKGAIRTALLDYVDRKYQLGLKEAKERDEEARRQKGSNNEYQKRRSNEYDRIISGIFGDIRDSVFKDLKIPDFEFGAGDSHYVTAVEISNNLGRENSTPKDPCEVVSSRLTTAASPVITGRIGIGAINRHYSETLFIRRNKRFNEKWALSDIMAICNDFYKERYCAEKEKFYSLPHLAATGEELKRIDDEIEKPGKGEMILRVGHYSHVECVTITENAPLTRVVNGKKLPHGTTRTLADGVFPFGWVKIKV